VQQSLPPGGPLLRETLHIKKALVLRFHETIKPIAALYKNLLPPDVITLPNFLWAIATVKARNWGMAWRGQTLSVLAPVADLVNHRAPKGGGAQLVSRPRHAHAAHSTDMNQGIWGSGASDVEGQPFFELIAGSNYSRGQEIFINYGNDCNDKFLLNYGFSTQGPTPQCQWPDRRTEVAVGDGERGGSSYSSAYSSSIRALP